MPSLN